MRRHEPIVSKTGSHKKANKGPYRPRSYCCFEFREFAHDRSKVVWKVVSAQSLSHNLNDLVISHNCLLSSSEDPKDNGRNVEPWAQSFWIFNATPGKKSFGNSRVSEKIFKKLRVSRFQLWWQALKRWLKMLPFMQENKKGTTKDERRKSKEILKSERYWEEGQ